jgi:hypothetical protein
MSEERDYARPRLVTVNLALNELLELALSCVPPYMEQTINDLNTSWENILNKYDLNYNDKKRWGVKDNA